MWTPQVLEVTARLLSADAEGPARYQPEAVHLAYRCLARLSVLPQSPSEPREFIGPVLLGKVW